MRTAKRTLSLSPGSGEMAQMFVIVRRIWRERKENDIATTTGYESVCFGVFVCISGIIRAASCSRGCRFRSIQLHPETLTPNSFTHRGRMCWAPNVCVCCRLHATCIIVLVLCCAAQRFRYIRHREKRDGENKTEGTIISGTTRTRCLYDVYTEHRAYIYVCAICANVGIYSLDERRRAASANIMPHL